MAIIFEWDEAKRLANIQKHNIDFVGCERVFLGPAKTITIEDDSIDYGERRFVTLGLLNARVVVVVHTETEDVIRIITVRKAKKREQAIYFEAVAD